MRFFLAISAFFLLSFFVCICQNTRIQLGNLIKGYAMTPFEFGQKIAAGAIPAPVAQPSFTPPDQSQLDAFRQHIQGQGFHPSVASESVSNARLLGMDNALKGYSALQKQYPYNDGVAGTAARSSRQNYYDQLQANYNRNSAYPDRTPYSAKMEKIPQIGTTTPSNGLRRPSVSGGR